MIPRRAVVPQASGPTTLLVTGATAAAGASTVATNLACALRLLGSTVAVVDLSPYGMDALAHAQWVELCDDLERWRRDADFVLLDAARVSSALALDAAGLADCILLVVDAGTPVSVAADAVRSLYETWPDADVTIVINHATAEQHAEAAFCRLALTRPAHASGAVTWLGHVVQDAAVARAREAGRLVVEYLPHARASRCLRALAARLLGSSNTGAFDRCEPSRRETGPRPGMRPAPVPPAARVVLASVDRGGRGARAAGDEVLPCA